MSFTITIQDSPTLGTLTLGSETSSIERVQVELRTEATLSSRVHSQLLKMESSSLLSSQALLELQTWQKHYDSEWLNALNTEEAKENVSLALADLILLVLRPDISVAADAGKEELIDHLMEMEEALYEFLKETLPCYLTPSNEERPSEDTILKFLDNCKQFAAEAELLNQPLERVHQIYEKQMQKLEISVQQGKEKIQESFHKEKERLTSAYEKKKAITNAANQKVDSLMKKIEKASQELSDSLKGVQKIGEEMEKEHAHYITLLNQCDSLKEVKQ